MNTFFKISMLGFLGVALFAGCDKTKPYKVTVPPAQVHFTGDKTQVYSVVVDPVPTYKVTVGTTDVADVDREVGFAVKLSSGAVSGTDFTISPTDKVVIPAGHTTADITVQAKFNSYTAGEKDTLTFFLKEPSVKVAAFMDTVKLVLRGPCFDGDISASTPISMMNGDYTNTMEPGYGPYTSSITGLVHPATGTTSTGTINNVFDSFGPLTINFDWTDPNNVKVNIPLQQTDLDYDAGQPFLVRSSPGQVNKFSICNQTLTMTIDVIVNNYPAPGSAAYYDRNYAITMGR